MSNTFPSNPDHNNTWDNPTTGESFRFDRHRGWINTKGVRFDGGTMTNTLVLPDTRINGGLLSADEFVEGGDDDTDMTAWVGYLAADDLTAYMSVTYGAGKFVAVGDRDDKRDDSKQVMYSEDGINWNGVILGSNLSNAWRSVTYSEEKGLFVAVAIRGVSDNRVMYSEDGITWTGVVPPNLNEWRSVTYGAGKFVAVAAHKTTGKSTNMVMYSEDAITWTVLSGYDSNSWNSVTYSEEKGLFVAVSQTEANRVMYSEDGITWTAVASSNELNKWNSVTYGNGKFVAISWGGTTNRIMYSEDGITWTGTISSDDANEWSSVTYGAGYFVAVATYGTNRVMYSKDGITWTGTISSDDSNRWQSVTYGGGHFVAVASNGYQRVMVLDAPEGSDASDLYWNDEKVVVQQSSRTMTTSLTRLSSTISSRTGKVKYLQDSAPPETQTIELSEDSSETTDITYNNGELWYQPSTNTLHIRDSDDWVALFQ
jgi:hypothetical protein